MAEAAPMGSVAEVAPAARRYGGLMLLALAIYFVINILVRLSLPASLELDEAEQVFTSQWLALGYGPQPPLYNWLQIAVFALTGKTLLGLALLKNLLLFSTYVFYWLAARQVLKDEALRIAAVLGLLTLPQISFMAEQDLAHTVALIAATALFLYGFYRILNRPDSLGYLIAGIAAGLGLLSKYNFALLPAAALLAVLPEPHLRDRIVNWRLAIAVLVAAVIALPHLVWLVHHLDLATEQTLGKMTEHGSKPGLPPLIRGPGSLAVALVAFSGLTLVIFAAIYRRRTWHVLSARSPAIRVTERMLLILLVALLLIIVATGSMQVRERWLDPFLLVLPLYLAMKIEAAGAIDGIRWRGLLAIPLIIMIATPAAIALRVTIAPLTGSYTRLNIPTDDFVKTIVDGHGAMPSAVIADDRRLAGNIALLLPGVPAMTTQYPDFVLPFEADETRPVLLAWRTPPDGGMPDPFRRWLASHAVATVPEIRTLVLPYHHLKSGDRYSFSYAWVSPPGK